MTFQLPFTEPKGNNAVNRVVTFQSMNGVEAGPQTMAEAETIFNAHMTAVGLSLAGYHTQETVLSDGSVMRISSNSGQHAVMVWPVVASGGELLAHGFGVKHVWHEPRWYFKKTGDVWVAEQTPPQIVKTLVTYNHVTRDNGGSWSFVPLVCGKEAETLWDLSPHAGFKLTFTGAVLPMPSFGGINVYVPIALQYMGDTQLVWNPHPTHYAIDDAVLAADGERLYTMAEMASMGTADTSLFKLPACTDASGAEAALIQWRQLNVSPSLDIWRLKYASLVLARNGPKTYFQVARHETELSTQATLAPDTSTVSTVGPIDIPAAPAMDRISALSGNTSWQMIPGNPYTGGNGLAYFGVVISPTTLNATAAKLGGRTDTTATAPAEVLTNNVLAVPGTSQIEFVKLRNQLAFPYILKLHAASSSTVTPNLNPNGWGTHGGSVMLRELVHTMNSAPTFDLDFTWTRVPLLEGTLALNATAANSYKDITKRNTYTDPSYTGLGGIWTPLTTLPSVDDDPGNPTPATVGQIRWNTAFATRIPFDQYEINFPNATTRVSTDDRAIVNTASYTYKSRYVLDYDHRAKFLACIRVEVTASGAEWEQLPSGYRGELRAKTNPTYTAKVFFEARFTGVTLSLLLVEDTLTKAASEFAFVEHDNCLTWSTADPTGPLRVYHAPQLQVPYFGYGQMQNIAKHQGVNLNFASADEITIPEAQRSTRQLEESRYANGVEFPHRLRPQKRLYARTIKLSDYVDSALWLLRKTHVSAPQNRNYAAPDTALWHYAPNLKFAIETQKKYRIEIRDDGFVTWTDDIPPKAGDTRPIAELRETEVYYL